MFFLSEQNVSNAYEVFEPDQACAFAYGLGACYDSATAPSDDAVAARGICCLSGLLGAGQKCLRHSPTERYTLHSMVGAPQFASAVNVSVRNGPRNGSLEVSSLRGRGTIPGLIDVRAPLIAFAFG
jgi:hypothetical protein